MFWYNKASRCGGAAKFHIFRIKWKSFFVFLVTTENSFHSFIRSSLSLSLSLRFTQMVKAASDNGSCCSVAPFLNKCYDMVEDHSTDSIISWTQRGDSFIISNHSQFSLTLLPNYFKHNNFSSFVRQLNIYVRIPLFSLFFSNFIISNFHF